MGLFDDGIDAGGNPRDVDIGILEAIAAMETAIDGQVDDVLAVPAFLPKSSLVEVGVGINGSAAHAPSAARRHEARFVDLEGRPLIRVEATGVIGASVSFGNRSIVRIEADEVISASINLEIDADLDVIEVRFFRTKADLKGVGSVVRAEDAKFALEVFDPSGSTAVEVRGKLRAITVSGDVISHEQRVAFAFRKDGRNPGDVDGRFDEVAGARSFIEMKEESLLVRIANRAEDVREEVLGGIDVTTTVGEVRVCRENLVASNREGNPLVGRDAFRDIDPVARELDA